MLNTLIVEDELMARKALESLCKKYDYLSLVSICESAESALEILSKNQVDLIFLDIEMPGMSGLELMDKIPYQPQVVFTTSNKDYAYEAYEYDITDFLKKPITFDRFDKSVKKVEQRANQLNAIATASAQHEIFIKSDGRFIRLDYDDIFFFENVGDYIRAATTLGNFIFHDTMKGLDLKLKNPRFLKVHRSYIINIGKIKDIEDNTIVIDKSVIPISRAYKSILMNSLNII